MLLEKEGKYIKHKDVKNLLEDYGILKQQVQCYRDLNRKVMELFYLHCVGKVFVNNLQAVRMIKEYIRDLKEENAKLRNA